MVDFFNDVEAFLLAVIDEALRAKSVEITAFEGYFTSIKILGERGRPPTTIIGIRKLARCTFVSYQNIGSELFNTHLTDSQTDSPQ